MHVDPEIPDEVTERDLPIGARNELKTLSPENSVFVARHLAMSSMLIDSDPELAHEHALSASRKGGRIAMVRESLAITAYAIGDFALALRELRTYRRISGRDDEIALMVDCERGLGRPDRALELGRSVKRSDLDAGQQVQLAIAMSGARLDQGQAELALAELEIPQLDRTRAFDYSAGLFLAYATVLDELGRADEAEQWRTSAERAEEALADAVHTEFETIDIVTEVDEEALERVRTEEAAAAAAAESAAVEEPDGEFDEDLEVPEDIRREVTGIIADVESAADAHAARVGADAEATAIETEESDSGSAADATVRIDELVDDEGDVIARDDGSDTDDDQPSLFDL